MGKYLVLSDSHLGQRKTPGNPQYSLLSQAIDDPSPRAQALSARLQQFAGSDPVTLVVLGDLLDLSLAYFADAWADFDQLLRLLSPIDKVVWVVGNHDHHIWHMHSEEQRLTGRLRAGQQPAPGGIYCPTNGLEPFAVAPTLDVGRSVSLNIAYPTWLLELTDQRANLPEPLRKVLFCFSHGHLFGGIPTILSEILGDRLEDIIKQGQGVATATVNSPLIEFIWWLLGEIGEGMGVDGLTESVYVQLQKGETTELYRLLRSALGQLMPGGVLKGRVRQWLLDEVTEIAVSILSKALEKGSPAGRSYDRYRDVAGTRQQLENWCKVGLPAAPRAYVVYGHTHVSDMYAFEREAGSVVAFNMGSWLIEPGHADPQSQILLIDDAAPQLEPHWEHIGD